MRRIGLIFHFLRTNRQATKTMTAVQSMAAPACIVLLPVKVSRRMVTAAAVSYTHLDVYKRQAVYQLTAKAYYKIVS